MAYKRILLGTDGTDRAAQAADVAAAIAKAGADTFVAGSAIFGSSDYKVTIDAMRACLAGASR